MPRYYGIVLFAFAILAATAHNLASRYADKHVADLVVAGIGVGCIAMGVSIIYLRKALAAQSVDAFGRLAPSTRDTYLATMNFFRFKSIESYTLFWNAVGGVAFIVIGTIFVLNAIGLVPTR